MGKYGVGERNAEGQMVVDCVKHLFEEEGGAQSYIYEWRKEHTGRLYTV